MLMQPLCGAGAQTAREGARPCRAGVHHGRDREARLGRVRLVRAQQQGVLASRGQPLTPKGCSARYYYSLLLSCQMTTMCARALANLPACHSGAHLATKENPEVICEQVYDATPFLRDHPGGGDSILIVAGTDATEEFNAIHSDKAKAQLLEYCIGELADENMPRALPRMLRWAPGLQPLPFLCRSNERSCHHFSRRNCRSP